MIKNFILSRLEIVLPLLKVLLKRRRSDEKKWISTVPSIGPRENKIFFLLFLDEIVQQCALVPNTAVFGSTNLLVWPG